MSLYVVYKLIPQGPESFQLPYKQMYNVWFMQTPSPVAYFTFSKEQLPNKMTWKILKKNPTHKNLLLYSCQELPSSIVVVHEFQNI